MWIVRQARSLIIKVLTPLEIGISLLVAAVISIAFFIIVKSRYQLKMGGYKYPYREKIQHQIDSKRRSSGQLLRNDSPNPHVHLKIMAAAVLAVAPLLILPAAEHLAAAVAVLVNVSSPLKTGSKTD